MSNLTKDIQRIITENTVQEASEIIVNMIESESKKIPKTAYCESVISCIYKSGNKCQTDEPCTARYYL